jgi:DNA repair protein REV1
VTLETSSNGGVVDMGEPLAPASSASSDYFEPEDAAFNELLQTTVLPGDAQESQPKPEVHTDPPTGPPTLKRSHSMLEESDETVHHVIPLEKAHRLSDEDEETYGASSFGGYGQYMRRKRAKLQIQNAQIDSADETLQNKSRIFREIAIYVRFEFVRASNN